VATATLNRCPPELKFRLHTDPLTLADRGRLAAGGWRLKR